MKNKKLMFTAFFFFAGALIALLWNIIGCKFYFDELNAYSATGEWAEMIAAQKIQTIIKIILGFLYKFLLGLFLVFLFRTKRLINFCKIRNLWVGIFAFFVINTLYWPVANFCLGLLPYYSSETIRHLHGAVEQSQCTVSISPFHTIRFFVQIIFQFIFHPDSFADFSPIYMGLPDFFTALLILIGFIKGMQILNIEAKIQSVESESDVESNEQNENSFAAKTTGFFQAIKSCFVKSFSFKGCASRAEYWFFILFCAVIQILLFVLSNVMRVNYEFSIYPFLLSFIYIFSVVIMPAIISVGVRRMHDAGKRGFFIAIPIVSFIITLMPRAESREYRCRKIVHPISNAIGMASLISFCTIYLFYVIQIIRIVWGRF